MVRRRMMTGFRMGLIILSLMLIVSLVPACSTGEAKLTTEGVLEEAYAASLDIQSYRYTIEMTVYGCCMGKYERSTEGEFVSPDRVHESLQHIHWAKDDDGDVAWSWVIAVEGTWEFIDIGNKGYIRFAESNYSGAYPLKDERDWYEVEMGEEIGNVPGLRPPFDRDGKRVDFWCSLIDPVELAEERIDGVLCLHYKGIADIDKYVALQSPPFGPETGTQTEEETKWFEWLRQTDCTIEIWIAKHDYRIRQVKVEAENWVCPDSPCPCLFEIPGYPYASESLLFQFYDYDQPIEINPPI